MFKSLTEQIGKVTQSISTFEFQNELLRKENADLQELVKGIQSENQMIK
jgi:hypothetical protein